MGNKIVFGLVIFGLLACQIVASLTADYPLVDIKLTSDNAKLAVKSRVKFILNCTFSFRNNFVANWKNGKTTWWPTVYFYKDNDIFGKFNYFEDNFAYTTVKLFKDMNAFGLKDNSTSNRYSSSIAIEPESKFGAAGFYQCLVTFGVNPPKAQFFSNELLFKSSQI